MDPGQRHASAASPATARPCNIWALRPAWQHLGAVTGKAARTDERRLQFVCTDRAAAVGVESRERLAAGRDVVLVQRREHSETDIYFGAALRFQRKIAAPMASGMLLQIQTAIEPVLERCFTKRRRQDFLAQAGPALLCLTFLEDALRVLLRWNEQMSFMTTTMKRCARHGPCSPAWPPSAWQWRPAVPSKSPALMLRCDFPLSQGACACRPAPADFDGRSDRGQRHDPAARPRQAQPREDGLLHAPRLRVCAAVHVRPVEGPGAYAWLSRKAMPE